MAFKLPRWFGRSNRHAMTLFLKFVGGYKIGVVIKEKTPFDLDTFLQTERSWLTLFFQVSSSPISNWDYILIKSSSLLIPSGKLARTISIFFYRLRSLLGLSLFYFWSFWIFDWTATNDLPSSLATYLILLAEMVAPHSMALLSTST